MEEGPSPLLIATGESIPLLCLEGVPDTRGQPGRPLHPRLSPAGSTRAPPGDLPNPGMEPASLMSPALAGGFFITSATWETCILPCTLHQILSILGSSQTPMVVVD